MRVKRKKSVSVLRQRLRAGLCRRRLFPFIRGDGLVERPYVAPLARNNSQSVNTS